MFSRTALLTSALAWDPGKVTIGEAEAALAEHEAAGALHAARMPGMEGLLTTDRAVADERETIALMGAGRERTRAPMRPRAVDKALQQRSRSPTARRRRSSSFSPRATTGWSASRAMPGAARPPC